MGLTSSPTLFPTSFGKKMHFFQRMSKNFCILVTGKSNIVPF